MKSVPGGLPTIRFGVFELDPSAGELHKQGLKVRLQEQPLRILQILLESPGRLVTREELQTALWPSHSYVDFDQGLNRAINKLREALGDSQRVRDSSKPWPNADTASSFTSRGRRSRSAPCSYYR
jgi:DNA-binding winged helix-turn-helix (wHTH) protein